MNTTNDEGVKYPSVNSHPARVKYTPANSIPEWGMSPTEIYAALRQPIPLSWKPQTINDYGALLVPYIDARDVIKRLNGTLGLGGWQRTYTTVGGRVFCELRVKICGEWVTYSDTGVDTAIEKDKGQSSDAFKRAAVNVGIGLDIYDIDLIKVPKESVGKDYRGKHCIINKQGKPMTKEEINAVANAKTIWPQVAAVGTDEGVADTDETSSIPTTTPSTLFKIMESEPKTKPTNTKSNA